MRTLVAATDFSTNAKLALERGVSIARHRGARLVLVHAFAPLATGRLDLTVLPPNFESDLAKAALQALEEEAAGVRRDGVEVSTAIERGAPAQTILTLAENEGADLIVAGTRGAGGFEHALLGSVAESLVGGSSCPVLVIHENDVAALDPPRRVLVPTDLSGDVEHVAQALVDTFGSEGVDGEPVELILAHADRVPPLLVPAVEGLIGVSALPFSQVAEQIGAKLEPTAAKLRERGFGCRIEIRDGEPTASLTQLAGELDVDLIAMSTHGHSGFRRLLAGSTARRVVQHAPCPVLTVRAPKP